MSYHHHFDHLGNQLNPPKSNALQRGVQLAGFIVAAVMLLALIWGPRT